ncbi:MAG: hypothetical protein ACXABY_00705 [Candidatus Thorarchaeota archaeon]|jgi:hypothetical protein
MIEEVEYWQRPFMDIVREILEGRTHFFSWEQDPKAVTSVMVHFLSARGRYAKKTPSNLSKLLKKYKLSSPKDHSGWSPGEITYEYKLPSQEKAMGFVAEANRLQGVEAELVM